MERRKFLQALGTVACAGPRASGLEASPAPESRARGHGEPRVFLLDDGRHAGALYEFEPPLEPADLTLTVDQLVESGFDTLIHTSGLHGGIALYDSHVAQKLGDNVTRWTHSVHYRGARNLRHLIAHGHDPLKLLCSRCHEKGIWMIASNWVTLYGGTRAADGGSGFLSDFVYDHPQFQTGEDRDSRAALADPARFSFLHPELRRERFLVFEELLARYETDGIELNLTEHVPFCKFGEVGELAPILTQWIRELAQVARKAEKAQGLRKRIYVRIPARAEAWKLLGYDVATWVSEKLVDGLIVLPQQVGATMDQGADLSSATELGRKTGCRVLAGLSAHLGSQLETFATAPMTWAAAANAYAQGADGLGFAQYVWAPNGWPWTHDAYGTARLLGHPELLATANKLHRVTSRPRGAKNSPTLLPDESPLLPQPLGEGLPVELRLRLSDRLLEQHALGRIDSVRLRIRISNLEPALNQVRIELNGTPLPESLLKLHDLTYRLYRSGAITPYGYVYDYSLTPEHYPRPGQNSVKVTLVKSDPNIDVVHEVVNVDCSIDYRPHRNFESLRLEY